MTDCLESASPERGVVNADHPMLAGHFPGHPIVPGAWLLAWVVSAAARRLASQEQSHSIAAIKRVKFLRPLAPDRTFECVLNSSSRAGTIRFAVSCSGAVIVEGSLQLQPRVD